MSRLGVPARRRHATLWHARPRLRRLLPQVPLAGPLSTPPLPGHPPRDIHQLLWRPLLLRLAARAVVRSLRVHRDRGPVPARRLSRVQAGLRKVNQRRHRTGRAGVRLPHRHGFRGVVLPPLAPPGGCAGWSAKDDAALRDLPSVRCYSGAHGA